MPDLTFAVEGAEPILYAAAPQFAFKLRITNAGQEPIQAIALRCQIQIEATRRRYGESDHELLLELFGERDRWGQTLKSMLWTFASVVVPPFEGSTVAELPVVCTYDFNVAATKYFHALQDGEVPLTLLFSGTVFYVAEDGALQVAQIPWKAEASFRLPVRTWKEMMESYYPNITFLSLRTDVFDRLYRFKMEHSLPTWEQALELLLSREKVPE